MSKTRTVNVSPVGVLTCESCSWRLSRWENGSLAHYCAHPQNTSSAFGTPKGVYDARKPDGVCGPNGDLHSSKGHQLAADFARH